jgi:site-specific DNA-methyltransferase (adenine-specific)
MEPWLDKILVGDCREIMRQMPPESVDMVMFSPPYWGLRNYGEGTETVWDGDPNCQHEWGDRGFCSKCGAWRGQLGLEPDFHMYIQHLVEVCDLVWRVLKKTGSFYLNLGDTYYEKQLLGIPWRVALALQDRGWILRNAIIWYKPNHMPSSVKDRLTNSYEHVFFFVKSRRYYYDLDAIREPHSTKQAGRLRASEEVKALARKLVKHDLAVGRVGNFSYADPLHAKEYHPEGKNPGDVIKVKGGKYKEAGIHSPGERDWYLSEQRNLPPKEEIYQYLVYWKEKRGLSLEDIKRHFQDEGDKVSHWFTHPDSGHGFSYPSPEDWLKLKELLGFDDKYDRAMTETFLVPVTDLGHPLGKNPGDVVKWRAEDSPVVEHFRELGSGGHYDYGGLNSPEGVHYAEGVKNPGDFWEINTKPFPGQHFAVYPPELCVRPILASCPSWVCRKCGRPRERISKTISVPTRPALQIKGEYRQVDVETLGWTDCGCGEGFEPGVVLDPFCGSGTTCAVAKALGRHFIGIDINPQYVEMARQRVARVVRPLVPITKVAEALEAVRRV